MEVLNPCNFLSSTVIETSNPVPFYIRWYSQIKRSIGKLYYGLIINPLRNIRYRKNATYSHSPEDGLLNLKKGEWVEVRSFAEIFATLDEKRKHQGLYFMPDAERFCGGKFKVYKKVKTIKLESTGEIRKIKLPTVILDGVNCSGAHHADCDRACFHLWREVWLKRPSGK